MNKLVSVCISCFNHEKYIAEALDSVLAQTYSNYEIVIVDDGSLDKSADIIARYAEAYPEKIRFFPLKDNVGISAACNYTFQEARGEYIAFLGSDDRMRPGRLARQLEVLNNDSECLAVFSWINDINSNGKLMNGSIAAFFNVNIDNIRKKLLSGNFLNAPSVMLRREALMAAGAYKRDLLFTQDYYLWTRMLDLGEIKILPESLTDYRVHGDNISMGDRNARANAESAFIIGSAMLRWPAVKVFPDTADPESERYKIYPGICKKLKAGIMFDVPCFDLFAMHWLALTDQDDQLDDAFSDLARQVHTAASQKGLAIKLPDVKQGKFSKRSLLKHAIDPDLYSAWLEISQLRNAEVAALEGRIATSWRTHPIFTLLVSCDSVEFPWLADLLDSVAAQHYPHWRLVVLSDADAPDPMFDGGQLVWHGGVDLADGAELGRLCDHYLAETPDDWCALLPAACRLAPEALLLCADYLNRFQDKQAFYFDHDRVAVDGARCEPSLKPGFDLDFLYANDYIGSAVVFANRALQGAGGCGSAGAWAPLDALLRLCEQGAAARIGHIDRVLLSLAENYRVPAEVDARARATVCQSHFNRRGIEAKVLPGLLDGTLRVDYLHATTPLVSIIIPNKDKVEYLQPCVDSLIDKTDWPNWELLIVDNGSEEPETLEYYEVLQERLGSRLRLLSYPQSFNFSAQCNMGVEAAAGEYVLLLNNDTQIIQPKWLSRMMAHGQRPDIGAVGCRLVFPETGNIQHAGITFSFASEVEAMPGHQYLNAEGDTPGYLNGLWCEQAMPAVTAACLLTRKQVYQAVDGFDAENLAALYNDVDFGLKLNRAGYRVLYTPFAMLVHHGSTSIKADSAAQVERMLKNAVRSAAERRHMLKTWLPEMAADRHLSRHLVCNGSKIALQQTLPVPWDVHFHDCPRIYGFADGGGSGKYRVGQPLAMLQEQGRLAAMFTLSSPITPLPDLITARRMAADVFLLQTPVTNRHFEALTAYREHLPELRCIASLDDLLTAIPEESNVYKDWQRGFRDVRSRLRKGLALCDRLIVSTETLREFCAPLIEDIRVVPNRLRQQDWDGLTSLRAQGHKPRVGWVGALQHAGDLAIIRDVVRALQHEVEWVFMGMWPDGLEDIAMERHAAVPFEEYPHKVASLNLDIALAPLASNDFNRCKSNLRLLEYGALAWPVVCSDIDPYRSNHAPVTRVPEDAQAWVDAIRTLAQDPVRAEHEGQLLRAWVDRDYWLDDHWLEWEQALLK